MDISIKTLLKPGLRRSLLEIVLLALVIFASRSSLGDWNYVPSGSMKPTLLVGDMIYVDKLAYDLKVPFTTWHLKRWGDPTRGDIVVFYSPKEDIRMVKRVVGLPGDTVVLEDNRLTINGEPLHYAAPDLEAAARLSEAERRESLFATERLGERDHPVMRLQDATPQSSFGPVTLPEGKYLLMGDNRDHSADSRFFGLVERERILGQATRVLVSWNSDHYFLPRVDRFNHPLK